MRSPRIFVYAYLDQPAKALLQAQLPPESTVFVDKLAAPEIQASYLEPFRQCEICFGNIPAAWLKNSPSLRWLQLESVGFEYYRNVGDLPKGLFLTNLKGLFDRPAAETAIAGLLALYRGLDVLVPAQSERRWVSLELRPRLEILHGQRAVILGHGSIGRRLRKLLEAFDCTVQSFARTAPNAELRTPAELDLALAEAEIVACCLPNTRETTGFITRARLSRMRAGAIFVNIGRGSVVDEAALIECLQQQRLGGAVLDVTLEEPLPPDHPLWSCPRTLLLQHTGGGYRHELVDKAKAFLMNLSRYRAGETLMNSVDLARGY